MVPSNRKGQVLVEALIYASLLILLLCTIHIFEEKLQKRYQLYRWEKKKYVRQSH